MKPRHRKRGALIFSVLMALITAAVANEWAGLFEECKRAGLEPDSIMRIMTRFQEKGISEDTAQNLLAPACEAARTGLSPKPVLAKVEEGLGKNVSPTAIEEAARNRFRYLQRAGTMLQHRRRTSKRAEQDLVGSVALALESGVSEDTLQEVLDQSVDRRASEVRALVEAGETLFLNGFGPEAIRGFMMDCLQRNLRRIEILRTVRYAVQKRGSGMEPQTIRKALWGSDAAGVQQQGADHAPRQMDPSGSSGPVGGSGGIPSGGIPSGPSVMPRSPAGSSDSPGGSLSAPKPGTQGPPTGTPGSDGISPGVGSGGGGDDGGDPGKGPGGK